MKVEFDLKVFHLDDPQQYFHACHAFVVNPTAKNASGYTTSIVAMQIHLPDAVWERFLQVLVSAPIFAYVNYFYGP